MSLSNHIEALLFFSGEPMKISRISEILEKEKEEIIPAIDELEKNLENRGVRLIKNGEEISLGTSPESSPFCEKIAKEELNKNLGKAAMETLAIVLYKNKGEGISRSDIDYIRGVNSTFSLQNLLIRGLVQRKPGPKKNYIYQPTTQLLAHLGITKKEDLPEYETFEEKLNIVS